MDRVTHARFKRYATPQANGCWLWTGEGTRDGYGIFRPAGKRLMAHIWAYTTFTGPIPEGMQVDHRCHTEAVRDGSCVGGEDCQHRRCCNPAHLELVTASENTKRQAHANRMKDTCPKGHPLSGDNLIFRADQKRRCRECDRERKRRTSTP